MANGTSTGEALGSALARSTENILSFWIRDRQQRLRESEFENRKAYQQQGVSLNVLNATLPFLPAGKQIGEFDFVMEPISDLLSEEGAASFAEMVVPAAGGGSPDVFQAAKAAWFQNLIEEDPTEAERLVRGSVHQDLLGKPMSEWTFDETVAATTQVGLSSYRNWLSNPENDQAGREMFNTGRIAMGLSPTVAVQGPGGQDFVFDSSSALDFYKWQNQFTWGQKTFNRSQEVQMAQSLVSMLGSGGLEIDVESAMGLLQARRGGQEALGEFVADNPQLAIPADAMNNALLGQVGTMRTQLLSAFGPDQGARMVGALDFIQTLDPTNEDHERLASDFFNAINEAAINNPSIGVPVFPGTKRKGWFGFLPGSGARFTQPDSPIPPSNRAIKQATAEAFLGGEGDTRMLREAGLSPQEITELVRERARGVSNRGEEGQ